MATKKKKPAKDPELKTIRMTGLVAAKGGGWHRIEGDVHPDDIQNVVVEQPKGKDVAIARAESALLQSTRQR